MQRVAVLFAAVSTEISVLFECRVCRLRAIERVVVTCTRCVGDSVMSFRF